MNKVIKFKIGWLICKNFLWTMIKIKDLFLRQKNIRVIFGESPLKPYNIAIGSFFFVKARIAQLVEQQIENLLVDSSNLSS